MKKTLLAAALLALSGLQAVAGEARLLRFPATNGKEIAFTYAGDLFTVPVSGGQARRLTSDIGFECFAHYSPDGRTIAFTAEYDGNREVYVMPAEGGEPTRVTYTSTNSRDDMGDRMGPNNIVMGWTPDGKYIIFRNRIGDGFEGKLWKVKPDGSMPEALPLPSGGFCSYSPDGSKLAYNRVMREFRTWKYYRGGMADEVWIYDGKSVKAITDSPAQDIFPMWIGNEIYFASDRDMTMNLFVYDTVSGNTSKVTAFDDFDVKFPSTDGKSIVFENGGYIYRLDPATKKAVKVNVSLSSDLVYARAERRDLSRSVRAASPSPDGSRVAVTARGEVFDVPAAEGVTRNISRSPASNDRGASWSPDGKYIAWIGDSTGETELYLYTVAEGGVAKQLTKGNDTYIRSFQWAPDSRHLLYTDRANRIVEVALDGAKRTVMQNPNAEFRDVVYSPDSKWLAYSRPAANQFGVVYVYNLASSKEYPVTAGWYDSGMPQFSSDGKYLIFTAGTEMNPIYSRIEWDYAMTDMNATYMAMLAKDTPSPLLPSDGTLAEAPKAPEKPAADKPAKGSKSAKPAADKPEKPAVEVVIDPEGLQERVVKLPFKAGYSYYCDGKKIWYGGAGGTQVFDFRTGKSEEAAKGRMSYRPGDKKAILMERGDFTLANLGDKMHGEKVSMKDVSAVVDYSQEWPQVFDEVWRAYRDGFYLENMHGRDWKALKEKYAALLPYVKTRLDLNYVIGEMIAEMACGHNYVNPGEYPKAEKVQNGLLGAELSKDKSGFFRIDRILQGAPYRESLRSPLAEPGVGVSEGQFITAIDGVSVKDVPNIYSLLVGKAGVLTELTVNASAAAGGKKVVVKPIADEYPLYHYEWVQGNIKTVNEKSGGKVGYIYIPDMGQEGLSEFARYYYPQLDKEALIIDDRANGGGNVSPMIIERLQREAYRLTMRRGSDMIGTVPEGTHTGPKVLLINKYSASDGDLFPWSFKANKLGTVIGTRTWGGIVGISGPLQYMDGTDVRVPFFTNYDAETGKWIVENHGVDPDILLENDPIKEWNGTDEQLLKAIEVALEQIKDRKPLPGVPEPRTYKDLGLPEMSF
ncbi:MAG: PDZ domain-containing protein [Bacteroidales bacterium]|nr:PDZ domain-containing protein [Bacteroidales bacterium]